ncbi:BCCT family transporter [Metapseudomonas furukawaii]|uniref:Glycine betaine transporter n=1 Tax=Metapseudomonas furukawaii TaxID=1149133 RepID=A0AAD1BWD0_METFU|nr:BCCT family transporter [Pseudomonas furukawaii]BAU72503.1 glycine betaine transporter [Pseudomonas furukawaii]
MKQHPLRPLVFWPTFLILLAAVVASYLDLSLFLAISKGLNALILDNLAWLFCIAALGMVILALAVYFSPLGQIRIGGERATPLLSKPRWFMVTLCTTLAVGVLFWAVAEPLFHLHGPPGDLGIEAESPAAVRFALSTMFMHWTITPYAIYLVPSLVFALAFHNLRGEFSIGAMLRPLLGAERVRRYADLIDTLGLFALVAGIASALGTGALTLAGGLSQYIGGETTPLRLALIIAAIVLTFVASAASGLQRGIAKLSGLNTWILMALGGFVLLCGPTLTLISLGIEALGAYLGGFLRQSLYTGTAGGDPWAREWTVFFWAVWFAWAPVAALFLGKIARGYRVREFIRINMLYPALFSMLWMSIFSGSSLYYDAQGGGSLNLVLNQQGVEHVLYAMFRQLPASDVVIAFLLFVAFINFVTAADSNTDAIGNLCSRGVTADSDLDGNPLLKVAWGLIIGAMAWVMVAFVGLDGVKMLSNLGGLPGMFIVLGAGGTLMLWLRTPALLADRDAGVAPQARPSSTIAKSQAGR